MSRDCSYVTGGQGLYEDFFPLDKLEPVLHSASRPETCNIYNKLKLTTLGEVKFQPKPGAMGGGLFDYRTVK